MQWSTDLWQVLCGTKEIQSISEDLLANPEPYDFLHHRSKLVARKILLIGGLDDPNVVVENHIIPGYRTLKKLGCESIKMKIFQDDYAFTNSRAEVATSISDWITAALHPEAQFT